MIMKNFNIAFKHTLLLTISILLIVCSFSVVSATNITITNETSGGINKALNDIDTHTGNVITLSEGNYSGVNNTGLTVNKNVTIQGTSASKVILDGENVRRIFNIGSNVNVIFINITFINGYSQYQGGAIFNNNGNSGMTFIDCIFKNSTTNGAGNNRGGGTIYNANGNLTIINCTFIGNGVGNGTFTGSYSGVYMGGAISSEYSKNLKIINSTFINNRAVSGGAIGTFGENILIDGCVFENNTVYSGTNGVGGIYIHQATPNVTIINSNFTHNIGTYVGALYLNARDVTIDNCIFTNNIKAGGYSIGVASGIWILPWGNSKISNCLFENNSVNSPSSADIGGTIYIYPINNHLIIENCTFKNNTMTTSANGNGGGAIFNEGNVTVNKCIFIDNRASKNGGAILNNGIMIIENSTFKNNSLNGVYSIYNSRNMSVSNNFMSENKYIYNNGNMGILNLTYIDNKTFTAPLNTQVPIYVLLTDDMGNPVSGGKITVFIGNIGNYLTIFLKYLVYL